MCVNISQVKPIWLRIQLQMAAALMCRHYDAFHIDIIRIALSD